MHEFVNGVMKDGRQDSGRRSAFLMWVESEFRPAGNGGSRVMPNADGVEPNDGLNVKSDLPNCFISSLDYPSVKYALEVFKQREPASRKCKKTAMIQHLTQTKRVT